MAEVNLAGQRPDILKYAAEFFKQNKDMPEWAQQKLFDAQFKAPESSFDTAFGTYITSLADPEKQAVIRKGQLEDLLALQKEQMRQAAPYKLIFELPKTITEAATLPSRLAAEGAAGIAGSMMQAGQQIPNLVGYQRGNFNYAPTKYF